MKTRRASGKLIQKAVKYVAEDSEDDDDDNAVTYEDEDISDVEPMPPKKRRLADDNENKSSKAVGLPASKGKGKEKAYRGKNVGKLAKLLEMPVDIFCEITVYLEPLDLLRLARSTREFNKMLMSRSSRPIWRTARNYYADLPDCPPDLSEPEYARLLFERDCHVCLAPRVSKVDYILRARLCHRCRSSNIARGTQLLKTIPHLTEELLECIPCRNHRWGSQRYRRLEYFYRAQVEKLVAKFLAAVPQGTPADQAIALRIAFHDNNKALIEQILKHASDVNQWLLSDRMIKQEEAGDAAARRRAKITVELVGLGYSKSDFPTAWEEGDIEWEKIMDQPRDLTPRIWTNARPKLEAIIQNVKSRREERARDRRQDLRENEVRVLLTMPSKWPHMDLEDVLKLPTVKAMVSEDDWQREVTREKWEAALPQIEQDRANQFERELTRLFRRSRQMSDSSAHGASCTSPVADYALPSGSAVAEAEDIDFAILSSASTFFECTDCLSLLQYPGILDHYHSWSSKWKSENFIVGAATRIAESLLASAPQQDGHENFKEERFLCLRCDRNLRWPVTWSALVKHFMDTERSYDDQLERQSMSFSQSPLRNDHALDTKKPVFTILSSGAAVAPQDESRDGTSEPQSSRAGPSVGNVWP